MIHPNTQSRHHHAPHPHASKRALALIALLLVLIVLAFFADHLRMTAEQKAYPLKYSGYVQKYAAQCDIPAHLLFAVIRTESDFDSSAVSHAGAVGLMQLMPDTFRWISDDLIGERLPDGMIYDPETNIRYGTFLLHRWYARYGDWTCALAAYNAGPGNVDAWLKDPACTDDSGALIVSEIPYKETRNYVLRVLEAARAYDRLYGNVPEESQ